MVANDLAELRWAGEGVDVEVCRRRRRDTTSAQTNRVSCAELAQLIAKPLCALTSCLSFSLSLVRLVARRLEFNASQIGDVFISLIRPLLDLFGGGGGGDETTAPNKSSRRKVAASNKKKKKSNKQSNTQRKGRPRAAATASAPDKAGESVLESADTIR